MVKRRVRIGFGTKEDWLDREQSQKNKTERDWQHDRIVKRLRYRKRTRVREAEPTMKKWADTAAQRDRDREQKRERRRHRKTISIEAVVGQQIEPATPSFLDALIAADATITRMASLTQEQQQCLRAYLDHRLSEM